MGTWRADPLARPLHGAKRRRPQSAAAGRPGLPSSERRAVRGSRASRRTAGARAALPAAAGPTSSAAGRWVRREHHRADRPGRQALRSASRKAVRGGRPAADYKEPAGRGDRPRAAAGPVRGRIRRTGRFGAPFRLRGPIRPSSAGIGPPPPPPPRAHTLPKSAPAPPALGRQRRNAGILGPMAGQRAATLA